MSPTNDIVSEISYSLERIASNVVAIHKNGRSGIDSVYFYGQIHDGANLAMLYSSLLISGVVYCPGNLTFVNGKLINIRKMYELFECYYMTYEDPIRAGSNSNFAITNESVHHLPTNKITPISDVTADNLETVEDIIITEKSESKHTVILSTYTVFIDNIPHDRKKIADVLRRKCVVADKSIDSGTELQYYGGVFALGDNYKFTVRYILQIIDGENCVCRNIAIGSTDKIGIIGASCTQKCDGFELITYIDGSYKIDIPNFTCIGTVGILRSLTSENIELIVGQKERLTINFADIAYGFFVTPSVYMINCGKPLYIICNRESWKDLLDYVHKRISPQLPGDCDKCSDNK